MSVRLEISNLDGDIIARSQDVDSYAEAVAARASLCEADASLRALSWCVVGVATGEPVDGAKRRAIDTSGEALEEPSDEPS